MRIAIARTNRIYDKYNRAPEPPPRHLPVVRDGLTLTNPLDDTERVLGEGRGLNPGRRGLLWAGIGAATGAIPGVGVLSNLAGTKMAGRGMDQRDNPDGMPLITPLLALGAGASMLTSAAAFATGSLGLHLLASGIGAVSGAASWGVAGYHGRNFM